MKHLVSAHRKFTPQKFVSERKKSLFLTPNLTGNCGTNGNGNFFFFLLLLSLSLSFVLGKKKEKHSHTTTDHKMCLLLFTTAFFSSSICFPRASQARIIKKKSRNRILQITERPNSLVNAIKLFSFCTINTLGEAKKTKDPTILT